MEVTLPPNIVITGAFRSGTTLLLLLFPYAFRDVITHEGEITALNVQLPSVYKWRVSKLPNDIHHVRILHEKLDPYIVYMLRDPRDSIVSWKEIKNDYHLSYDEWQRNLIFAESAKSPKLIILRFEDLISRPEQIENTIVERIQGIEKKCNFAECYKYMDSKSPYLHQLTHDSGPNRSRENIRPMDQSVIGSWRYDKVRIWQQLKKFPEMQATLEKYGYEKDDSWQRLLCKAETKRKKNPNRAKNDKSIIAIIPARKGSKRIPGKNTALLAGKSLVEHAIDIALEADIFSGIYVSTDDPKVISIAKERGVEVIKRPAVLANDNVVVDKALLHVVEHLEQHGQRFEAACLMTPTAPLRMVKDVRGAVQLLWEKDADFVITVALYDHSPFYALVIKNGILKPSFMSYDVFTNDSKSLQPLYRPIAVARIGRWGAIKKYGTTFSPGMVPYIIPPEHAVDIDNKIDFEWAEFLLKRRKQQNNLK